MFTTRNFIGIIIVMYISLIYYISIYKSVINCNITYFSVIVDTFTTWINWLINIKHNQKWCDCVVRVAYVAPGVAMWRLAWWCGAWRGDVSPGVAMWRLAWRCGAWRGDVAPGVVPQLMVMQMFGCGCMFWFPIAWPYNYTLGNAAAAIVSDVSLTILYELFEVYTSVIY